MKISNLKNISIESMVRSPKFLIAFASIALLALIWDLTHMNSDHDKSPIETTASVDTYIPEGYVLVPIEIQNLSSLDSILGNFGIVDLYLPTSDRNKIARKIAQRVKIMRAPLNPQQFAVLVPEADSLKIAQEAGPYFVMIQNPKQQGSAVLKTKNKNVINIISEEI